MGQVAPDPQGTLVDSFDALRELISHCVEWHNWTGIQSAKPAEEASAERIHRVALPVPRDRNKGYQRDELETLRPFIVIDYPPPEAEDEEAFVAQFAGSGYFAHRGRLNLRFEADVPVELRSDLAAAKLDFMAHLGRLIEQMTDLANTSGYLSVSEFRLWCPPIRSDEVEGLSEKGDFFTADLLVSWGLRPR